jgi:LysR family glycine cleavage system transcriptional activator
MSRRLPNLNALRAFEAAARLMSFKQAAEELCVTQGAISRHVKALESYLGVLLFRRMTRAVELTDEGREYLPVAKDAFDRIEQASARLKRGSQKGVLTVSVLPTFAMRWLIPRLSRFTSSHPDTEVRMITSILPVSFGRDAIDLAIRVGHLPETQRPPGRARIDLEMVEDWNSVHADMLMPDVLIPVCSPGLLASGDIEVAEPRDILRYTLLHTATRAHAWPDWFSSQGIQSPRIETGPAFGHFFMAMQAAMDGQGIALVPRALAEGDIIAGRLAQPVRQEAESDGAYYVLCRRQQRDSDPILQFRTWILAERDRASAQFQA